MQGVGRAESGSEARTEYSRLPEFRSSALLCSSLSALRLRILVKNAHKTQKNTTKHDKTHEKNKEK